MQGAVALLDDLRAGKLALAFQPIMSLDEDGERACLYSEALLRRRQEENESSHAGPDAIETLERLGWIPRLDCSVVWTIVRLLERHPTQRIGCNVSALSIYDDAWWRALLAYLKENPSLARRFTLEITETGFIGDLDEARGLIASLRATGVRIAVDDVSADNRALELLSYLRADIAKIDRSVLRIDGSLSLPDPDLLPKLITACAGYSPYVVVEGIENAIELRAACRAGAQGIQGFLIERPDLRPAWLQQAPAVVMDAYACPSFAPEGRMR